MFINRLWSIKSGVFLNFATNYSYLRYYVYKHRL